MGLYMCTLANWQLVINPAVSPISFLTILSSVYTRISYLLVPGVLLEVQRSGNADCEEVCAFRGDFQPLPSLRTGRYQTD